MPFSSTPFEIGERLGIRVHPESFIHQGEAVCLLAESQAGPELIVLATSDHPWLERFQGKADGWEGGFVLKRCPANETNAAALREALPSLKPALLGLRPSVGFGDRLGLATPGHVLALTRTDPGRRLLPIFAQQSRREMVRSNRSPEQVMADATWGAFQAGWTGSVGADADHLKTIEDIDLCALAGFTFFTLDPGGFVDSQAEHDDLGVLKDKVRQLSPADLECSMNDLLHSYTDRKVKAEHLSFILSEPVVLRAEAKYGKAILHVVRLYRHLLELGRPFELEISVDETETPTTHAEHYFIACELKRLGVEWVSLAPRFVGSFEKGVDYLSPQGIIGDGKAFATDVNGHAAIARTLGPYKLSLHSGSDKFSIYPLVQEATRGLVHLKTAGTSYLEALRVMAIFEPVLFREILRTARQHYDEDRASYHVSADLSHVPDPDRLGTGKFPELLDDRTARQVLHVTFGSVLAELGPQLLKALRAHLGPYYETLAGHFGRHLKPFLKDYSLGSQGRSHDNN